MPYPTLYPDENLEHDVGGGSVYVGVKTNGSPSEAMYALTSEQMAVLNGLKIYQLLFQNFRRVIRKPRKLSHGCSCLKNMLLLDWE